MSKWAPLLVLPAILVWAWFISSVQEIPAALKLVAIFCILIVVALVWFQAVKAFLAQKLRIGIGQIVIGIGFLTWAFLGVYIFPHDRFNSLIEWGVLVTGGVLIFIGGVLRDSRPR